MIFTAFAPFLSISAAIILLIGAHFLKWSLHLILFILSLCLLTAWFFSFSDQSYNVNFWGMSFDALGSLGLRLIIPFAFLILLLSRTKDSYNKNVGGFLLILLSSLGSIGVVLSHNWMSFFLSIQCMSIPLYGLIANDTESHLRVSTSIRYLILSAISMGFMLFGMLLLYASLGSLDFYEQAKVLPTALLENKTLLVASFTLLLVGVGFKLSIFPMHIWTPEVYQGSPFFTVAFMLIIAKASVLITSIRIWQLLFNENAMSFVHLVGILAILSMWIGNGLMLLEKNFMRMLAFLSIGHLGFLLTALLLRNNLGIQAIFIDLTAFSVAIIIICAVLTSLNTHEITGLYYRNKKHAIILCLCLISLMGIPLTPGFLGKYMVFAANIDAEFWRYLPHMLITSFMGICGLARFIIQIFEKTHDEEYSQTRLNPLLSLGIIIFFILGIVPENLIFMIKTLTENYGK